MDFCKRDKVSAAGTHRIKWNYSNIPVDGLSMNYHNGLVQT